MKVGIQWPSNLISISLNSFTLIYLTYKQKVPSKMISLNATSELLSFHFHLEMEIFPFHL